MCAYRYHNQYMYVYVYLYDNHYVYEYVYLYKINNLPKIIGVIKICVHVYVYMIIYAYWKAIISICSLISQFFFL